MSFRLNMKRTSVLERIQLIEQAITKAKEYLESGKHAHWIGFRPLFVSKLKDGKELDMGTPHDSFADEAHTANATGVVAQNRAKLVDAMKVVGFTNYDMEWWHFSFEVQNPRRFDVDVR